MANVSLFSALGNAVRQKTLSSIDSRGGWRSLIREPYTGAWQRNDEWKSEDLLCSPIVYSCLTLIANDIGKLRARLVEKDQNGIWTEVGSSPYQYVLQRPNRYQNHIQFKQWWVTSKLRKGNSYAIKERDRTGVVKKLYLLDPDLVSPMVSDDGSVFYQLTQDNLAGLRSSLLVPASEIIHDRMNCLYHPLVGIAPLYAAAIAAGIGMRIQHNTAHFFKNNSKPSGVLVVPGNISEEAAAEMKQAWDSGYTGDNVGRVAVLADGLKFEPMAQNAVDSQLIETLKWSDERICSVFHVPGYKVGVGEMPSYNNIEALEQGYYSNCLQSLIEEMEACLDEGLNLETPTAGRSMGVELDLTGLLRMDSKSKMETMKLGVDGAISTPNEARRSLNLPPLPGGDTVYMQVQNYSLRALNDRDKTNPLAASAPAPAEVSAEDQAAINEAKAIIATQKAIETMRTKVTENMNV